MDLSEEYGRGPLFVAIYKVIDWSTVVMVTVMVIDWSTVVPLATARPIPDEAPVTTATLPSSARGSDEDSFMATGEMICQD